MSRSDGWSELMHRIDALLADHIADLDLTVATVAHAVGVTECELRRITSEKDVDVQRWIVGARLSRARRDLMSASAEPDTVFAREHGFHDLAALVVAFTTTYGLTPYAWWAMRAEG